MGIVESFFIKYFGQKFVNWATAKGLGKIRDRAAKGKAKAILREFLIDTNGQAKLDDYLARLDALGSDTKEVHDTRAVIKRTTPKVLPKAQVPLLVGAKKKATKKAKKASGGARRPARKARPSRRRQKSRRSARRSSRRHTRR